jgi:hypothetical protein
MTNQKTFVQLGRAGDILNILPLVKQYRDDSGMQPALMVSSDYAGLLDGVSYCDRLIYDGEFTSLSKAIFKARHHSADIVNCQIYGDICDNKPQAESFAIESWLQAGAVVPHGTLPLVIDKRDYSAEADLFNSLCLNLTRPYILVALNGISSPFPYNKSAWAEIDKAFGHDFQLIDLSKVKAEKFFDLLGLIDNAHCLVTVDTGVLHLAAASNTPVISLITRSPSPWHGTPWRKNHVGRFYYDEFPRCMPAFIQAIAHARETPPKIVHAYSSAGYSEVYNDASRRMAVAAKSWGLEYQTGYWDAAPFQLQDMTRNAVGIGDERPAPFLRDVIENAFPATIKPGDIIAFTNADVCFAPGLTGKILEKVSRYGAAFTHRWDFSRLEEPFAYAHLVRNGRFYPGSDAFFFSRAWWVDHGHELPDMLMGREKNDEVLRQLIKYHGGAEIDKAIYHEEHESFWERPGNKENNIGNIYNRNLAAGWFKKMGLAENDFLYWAKVNT